MSTDRTFCPEDTVTPDKELWFRRCDRYFGRRMFRSVDETYMQAFDRMERKRVH